MDKKDIKQIFDEVQLKLDTLQGEDATFMFIGHEGNHFVLGGNPDNIAAQIVFAMIRYPIVRDIIQKCAVNYETLNAKLGKQVKDVKMDHLIEQNSGNEAD